MDLYAELVWSIERAHYAFLSMIRQELERRQIRDINNIQAMMVFNLAEYEVSVSDLTRRGCYLGSNVSYNVKKLIERDYLKSRRSEEDRRSFYVKLSDKGRALYREFDELFKQQEQYLTDEGQEHNAQITSRTMRYLDRFWDQVAANGAREPARIADENQPAPPEVSRETC